MIPYTNGKILKRLFKRSFAVHPVNKEEKCNKNCKDYPLKKQVKNLSKIKNRTSNK